MSRARSAGDEVRLAMRAVRAALSHLRSAYDYPALPGTEAKRKARHIWLDDELRQLALLAARYDGERAAQKRRAA